MALDYIVIILSYLIIGVENEIFSFCIALLNLFYFIVRLRLDDVIFATLNFFIYLSILIFTCGFLLSGDISRFLYISIPHLLVVLWTNFLWLTDKIEWLSHFGSNNKTEKRVGYWLAIVGCNLGSFSRNLSVAWFFRLTPRRQNFFRVVFETVLSFYSDVLLLGNRLSYTSQIRVFRMSDAARRARMAGANTSLSYVLFALVVGVTIILWFIERN